MNRLAEETSPYLRQHAENPVDWYPWGDEAFAEARRRDRPVFLSVGYSACHWCHVMAHESFEDPAVAEVLNRDFVAVKVDREERPDVDAIYMEAVQALSGHGGWPMSVFLTPDGRPFFAGTYFPPRDRGGLAGFGRILAAVDEAWRMRRDEVEHQAGALVDAVARRSTVPAVMTGAGSEGDPAARRVELLGAAVAELRRRADPGGGFSPAPKFPQPTLVELCVRHHRLHADPEVLDLAVSTLRAMAVGGIYDHLGGGFARYSTDATWTVPHFEKMLYDQAGLVRVYLHAWQHTGDPDWLAVVEETIEYVRRDLRAPEGGLCSAEDADSEGEEGRFYLWTRDELDAVLGPELAAVASAWYQVDAGPNFEGRSILRRAPGASLARPPDVEAARRALFEARERRVRPGLDDKVLLEWNAMFVSALAEAAAATGRPDWAEFAGRVAEFLWKEMRRAGDARWMRSWQGGRARHLAYAADHAWLVDAFTRMSELTGEARWLERASEVAAEMLRLFGDRAGGSPGAASGATVVGGGRAALLYSTGTDAEALVVRPTDVFDGAVPSANSVAAAALLRLGALTGDEVLGAAGQAIVDALAPVAREHPLAFANLVAAAALERGGLTEVVVAGDRPDLVEVVRGRYEPNVALAWGTHRDGPLWAGRAEGSAYVCRGFVCQRPATTPEELRDRLEDERRAEALVPGDP